MPFGYGLKRHTPQSPYSPWILTADGTMTAADRLPSVATLFPWARARLGVAKRSEYVTLVIITLSILLKVSFLTFRFLV